MAAVHDISRASRARPVRFILPGGQEIVVPPCSVDQAIDCLALDPAKGGAPETPLEELLRLRRQAQILLGPAHATLTGQLDKWHLGEIIGTLYVSACGLDAEAYARWQIAQRQSSAHPDATRMLENLEALTSALAAELKRLPAEVGAQPLADVVSLRENLDKERRRQAEFDASLHGQKLT